MMFENENSEEFCLRKIKETYYATHYDEPETSWLISPHSSDDGWRSVHV
eukprot:CAMPEP_0170189776 /NCGR_PEP_ID=MMETSP0040_2-20121228/47686_1 /TAXON_ID=641309 /ORGANISM="Lotharella oceanica, Strain CCMP622" /LENGTH=48 /DNA_ID= /DNA_START= /DNA_END= /DNA_ORIENTATION=